MVCCLIIWLGRNSLAAQREQGEIGVSLKVCLGDRWILNQALPPRQAIFTEEVEYEYFWNHSL
jgi:hypothetical protein